MPWMKASVKTPARSPCRNESKRRKQHDEKDNAADDKNLFSFSHDFSPFFVLCCILQLMRG
jgi:hypothetical protein